MEALKNKKCFLDILGWTAQISGFVFSIDYLASASLKRLPKNMAAVKISNVIEHSVRRTESYILGGHAAQRLQYPEDVLQLTPVV